MNPFLFMLFFAARVGAADDGMPTQPTDRFADSVGVCTHWDYSDTPYGFAFAAVKRQILRSGIRHVRDGLSDRLVELGQAGICATVVVDADKPIHEWRDAIKQANAAGARIVAVEGPNEPDLFWPRFGKHYPERSSQAGDDATVIQGVLAFQKDLYAALKGDCETRTLSVIGPALGKTYGYETGSPLGAGALTDYVDWGNFHPYPGGNPFSVPFPYAGLEKYLWEGGQPSANIDEFPYAFDIYAPPFAPKPMAATETGYSTFNAGTSEAAQAKYLPRLFCEYFRKGIVRTFSYEFVDGWNRPDDREANFGLLRHDLSPKPAYHALRRLLQLTAEPNAPPFIPKPLPGKLNICPAPGYDRIQYVHHVALQRSDGCYLLLIWHEIALDDATCKPWRRLPLAPPMPVTLKLTRPARRVEIFIPNDSDERLAVSTDTDIIALAVPDRVLVVRITM